MGGEGKTDRKKPSDVTRDELLKANQVLTRISFFSQEYTLKPLPKENMNIFYTKRYEKDLTWVIF